MSDTKQEPLNQVSTVLGQHSAAAASQDGTSRRRMHGAAASFLIGIQEANRKAEDEIIQRAVQPENKEK